MKDAEKKIRDAAILALVDLVERRGMGLELHPHDPANPQIGPWNVGLHTWGHREPQWFHGDSLAQACGKAFAHFRDPVHTTIDEHDGRRRPRGINDNCADCPARIYEPCQ